MTRLAQNTAAAIAAVAIMLATFVPVVTVPPASTLAMVTESVIA